ncbi:MAG: 4-hydroxy-tetrahydrodipicolinate synthase, partial [Phenylobacterium sp.]|nr:4-hydroxy-tetrahydrodipicolinate synthase [Phenylobacterium sp.]
MSDPLFRGVFPALVTPFRDGEVDEAAFIRLVE